MKKLINWKISMLWFWTAYLAVYTVITVHTVGLVLKMEALESYYPAYVKTLPFHPLYCIIIWSLFAFLYIKMVKTNENQLSTALALGISWSIIIIVIDLFGWVIIPHPFTLTLKEFYVDAQPWITFVYLAIFISPFLGMLLNKRIIKNGA